MCFLVGIGGAISVCKRGQRRCMWWVASGFTYTNKVAVVREIGGSGLTRCRRFVGERPGKLFRRSSG